MKGLIPIIWIVLLLMVVPSLAITIHIPADYTTIQAGINAANNDDEVLVADGTYSEHIDFLGKAIVVISENGAEATFIEKVYDDQTIVSFATGEDENSVLDGFTVRNSYDQAAIICDGTSPVIKNCIIEDNYNIIYSPSSTGGGLLFRNNAAPRITKNIFRDNYAMHGAAIAGYGCDEYHQALIDSNYIHNNETHNNGAGFHFYDCSFIFKHNLVFNNIAGVAGGAGRIDARGGIIENNAICNNAASSLAGGIFTDGNSTDTYIRNNIFYGNDFYGFYVASGSNFHLLYNCFYANVSGPYFYINPEEGNILVDPLMIDPENDDYNLTGSSPCINAGDPSSPQDPDGSRADIGALYYHEETSEELLEWIGSITTPGNTYGVDVVGQYAYTADYYEGMSVIDISDPVNPVIVGRESMPGRALDIRVNGNYAYCSDDGEGSLSIVDISDPANPTLTSTLYTTDRAYSLDVIGDYVFVADGGAGVQVVDVSDPYNPIIIDNIAFPTGGVFVEGNLGYIVNNSTGLIIIDITDPSNCITLGTTALSGDPHKGVRVRDGYAYVAVYHAGLEVIDVGDPNSPFSIGLADTPGNAWDVDIDGDFAFVTERESGLSVVDISNPSDPSLNSTYPINGVIHGVFASSNFVYVADGNSLEIFLREGTTSSLALDIGDVYSEPGQPVEVPITGLGFNDMEIAGVELHLAYNTDCLEYTNIVSDYLDDATINVVDGQIHILWENYLTPFMLPDESALLTLQFTILGELGQICEIDWADQNELVDPIGDPLAGIEYSPGSVEVTTFSDLAGNITYYDLTTFVADVTVNLEGEAQQETISDESGNYLFEDNPPGEYTICPSLADDDEAVTVGDIILIRRHIVQLELFDSPFNYIAADANGNGYVSVSDIIKLRRYLAELEDIPAGNWKFVDAAYEITEDNWADAPGCIDVTLEFTNISDLDFIGVRIGDVDRSWGSGGLILEAQTDSVTIDIVDGSGQIGEIIAIPITADGFTAVAGLELHLDYPENGLEIISIGHDNFDEPTINMGNGEIHLIWDDINDPVTVEDGEEIITLEFEILETALDTMPISFGINYVVDEYGTDYFVESRDGFAFAGPVFIGDENDNLPNSYGLAQNYPNPFNAQTTIKYNLPKSSQVSVAIYDILGNQIETLVSDNQPAGYHQIIWYAKDVSSGIYFYKIQAGDFNRAKKMILLK